MTPLKRAGRAALNALHSIVDEGIDLSQKEQAIIARAVLEAIRDVDAGSPAMLVAGKVSLYSCSEDPELEHARKCFHAMIDAALKEG